MKLDGMTDFDRALVHALHVVPRGPYRQLSEVLGASDQTVARRYRRLQETVGLRVTGQVDEARVGWTRWFVRLQCAPDAAAPLARALAQRADTAWIRLASGGTEIDCVISARDARTGDRPLLDRLAGSRRIVGVSAHSILHVFSPMAWPVLTAALSEEQLARLARPDSPTVAGDAPAVRLDATDVALLELLAHDGRSTPARLAESTGWHESTVRRRVAQLSDAGILVFDVDLDERAMGVTTTTTTLWASVEPARLQGVGRTMATHPEVPFVAATTGPTNLLASVVCNDNTELFDYLTTRMGGLAGVRHVETSPVIRTVKRAGPIRPT